MAALTQNLNKSQIQRALTQAAACAMSALVHNLRNKIIGAILAGLLAPQVVVAGGHGGSHGGGHGGSHGGHSSGGHASSRSFKQSNGPKMSSSASRGSSKQNTVKNSSSFTNRQFTDKTSKTLVPAKNGNTGINGTGLPGPYKSGSKVIAAKNGNTGINGTGLPQPTGGSRSGGKDRSPGTQTNKGLSAVKSFSAIGKNSRLDSAAKLSNLDRVGGSTNSPAKVSKHDLLQKYTKKFDGGGNSIKTTRSDLLKKYSNVQGGPKNSSNPGHHKHDKHRDKWSHNGFLWGWPFFPGFVSYPTPGVSCPNPVVFYEPSPDVVQVPAPVDATETTSEVATGPAYDPDSTVAETAPSPPQPTNAEPAQDQPVKADSSEPVVGNIDLVLEDVRFVEPATTTTGPAYTVKVRNQGTQAAGSFRVGVFAELEGKLSDDSPQAVVEVPSLQPGQAGEVTLRLPVTAMRLVSTSSAQANAFDELLVIVDLDEAVVESVKTNNVASLERTELEASSN